MPIKDNDLILMDETDIATTATSKAVGAVVRIPKGKDFKGNAADDRPNVSGRLYWNCVVEGTDLLAGTTGSVVTLTLYNHKTNTPTDGGTAILATVPVSVNDTTTNKPAGTVLGSIPLPSGALKEYFQVYLTVDTQTLAAGKVSSWIGGPIQQG